MKRIMAAGLWTVFVMSLALGYGCGGASPTAPRTGFTLGGKTYTEKYTCNEQFGGVPPTTCPDLNEVDVIIFQSTGANTVVGYDVPDTGYVYTGTRTGDVLNWTAISPLGYTEAGTWTFSPDGSTFSGTSHYVANAPGIYAGDCTTNGVLGSGSTPPDPPLPTGCP